MKLYLAGRVTGSDWRNQIVEGLSAAGTPDPPISGDYTRFVPLNQSILGDHDYTGPFFMTSFPAKGWHDCMPPGHRFGPEHPHNIEPQQDLINQLCLTAIDDCEVVFAWLDSTDLYGTFVEIGYAKGKHKGLWISGPKKIPDLWFAYESAGFVTFRCGRPRAALLDCLLMRELGHDYGLSDERQGFVYVLRAGPFYKIGRAKSVDNRLRQIKLQLPFEIELLHTIEASDCIAAEGALHRIFRRHRTNGEWFTLFDSDVDWLCSISDFLDIYSQD